MASNLFTQRVFARTTFVVSTSVSLLGCWITYKEFETRLTGYPVECVLTGTQPTKDNFGQLPVWTFQSNGENKTFTGLSLFLL